MKKLLLAIVLLALTESDLYAQQVIPSWQDTVMGTWIWKRTICCNMGGGSHKESRPNGREMVIVMGKDSAFSIYKENRLEYKGKYKVQSIKFMQDPITYMFFTERIYGMLRFKGDTLIIGNCATDGCDEFYVPEKTKKTRTFQNKKLKNVRQ